MASLMSPPYFSVGAGLTTADGAKLYFYVVGSDTPKSTYTTAEATTAHANPVIADAKGVFDAIYLSGDYDWVLQDKNSVQRNAGSVSEFATASNSAFDKNFATLTLAKADTNIIAGDAVSLKERTTGNGGGGMWDVISGTGTANTYNIVAHDTLSLSFVLRESLNPLAWGCFVNGTTDSSGPLLALIAYAAALAGTQTVVDLLGYTFASTLPVVIPVGVILENGTVLYTGGANDIAIVSIGDFNGDTLTRNAGAVNVRAKVPLTNTTSTGLIGLQMIGLVRACYFNNCIAEMNGDTANTRNHKGFELLANRLAASTAAGLYQNYVTDCMALFANTGLRLRTDGTDSEARLDPQCNGNFIKGFVAHSCRERAVHLDYGSQENEVEFRADGFPSAIGLGTTVNVVDIEGSYNNVHFAEEIGSIADTQYSIRLGDNAIYNQIEGATQNIVSGFLDDSATVIGKRAKNIVRQAGSGLISKGRTGSEATESFYETAGTSQSQLQQARWIAPSKCVVTRIAGRLNAIAGTGGNTNIYFGKNSVFSTSNRLSWAASAAISVKSLNIDASASVDISDIWVLEQDEFLSIAIDTPSGAGQTYTATFSVRYI